MPSTLELLREYESRNVTYLAADGSWPIVWERARGMAVWDEAGKRYLDFTAAFGVAAAGHANPRVVKAGQRQLARLPHAMGDVHPHALKAQLARELSRLTFGRWQGGQGPRRGKVVFGNSGFEAVEAALKTAMLATGKPGVIAFEGAYHGLGYGALNATHRDCFRSPFHRQLAEFAQFAPFPTLENELGETERQLRRIFKKGGTGAVLVEPIQGRGGMRVPSAGFLALLRRLCDDFGALLILDEIYTGFGRTGRWFACEHEGVVPDVICLGKGLTGGFPLSACVGRSDLMDAAWPASTGEAIHTSTFLGHPVGCAMALAEIKELRTRQLIRQSERQGQYLVAKLQVWARQQPVVREVRGRGLMLGIEFNSSGSLAAGDLCLRLVQRLLRAGFIVLPDGAQCEVLALTPPLIVTQPQMDRLLRALDLALRAELAAA